MMINIYQIEIMRCNYLKWKLTLVEYLVTYKFHNVKLKESPMKTQNKAIESLRWTQNIHKQ